MPSNRQISNPYIAADGHWITCMSCGFDFRAYNIVERWDGMQVCNRGGCNEPRHPQELIKVPTDRIAPEGIINYPDGTFTDVTFTSTLPDVPDGTFDNDL